VLAVLRSGRALSCVDSTGAGGGGGMTTSSAMLDNPVAVRPVLRHAPRVVPTDDDKLSEAVFDSFDGEAVMGGESLLTELAVVTVDANGKELRAPYSQLINPKIPTFDGMQNGINDELLKSQPVYKEIHADFCSQFTGNYAAGYNVSADVDFLQRSCRQAGEQMPVLEFLCLMRVSMLCVSAEEFGPEKRTLVNTCAFFKCPAITDKSHRALGDARRGSQLIPHLIRRLALKGITTRGELRKALKSAPAGASGAPAQSGRSGIYKMVSLGESVVVKKCELEWILEAQRQHKILRVGLAHPKQQGYAKLSLPHFVEAVVKENSHNACLFNSDARSGALLGFRGEHQGHIHFFAYPLASSALLPHNQCFIFAVTPGNVSAQCQNGIPVAKSVELVIRLYSNCSPASVFRTPHPDGKDRIPTTH
jgi:DNA polymerase III epsilon subunit-like protein